jgi:hypothetical protein
MAQGTVINPNAQFDPSKITDPAVAERYMAKQGAMKAQAEMEKRTLRDNAGFSEFFNKAGITDAQREAAPAYASGQYGGVPMSDAQVMGLRRGGQNDGPLARLKLDNSSDQIYRQGNTYTGMGAPSRVEAEIAKANDPAVKKEAMMTSLRNAAMTGDKQAMEMYNAHLQADSYANTAAQAVEQARVKAGAEGKGADSQEYKLLKDAATQVKFFVPKEDGTFADDGPKQAAFNDFWADDIRKQKLKAAKAGQPLEGLDDPAVVAAYMQGAKARFEMMQHVNAKSSGNKAQKFNRGLSSAKLIPDLTLSDAGGPGGHSYGDAVWDNMPFTQKGGVQFQDENGLGQTIPRHSGDFNSLGSAQQEVLRRLLEQGGVQQ